ncbi:UNVERIFIED_CONTAM: hypothetical protein GTU68_001293 [Idotea baltica]|nr:hypothetical protein [Idotea baltica]
MDSLLRLLVAQVTKVNYLVQLDW